MRGNIVMIVFACLVLAVSVALVLWIGTGAEQLLNLCSCIESGVIKGDPDTAQYIRQLKLAWQKDSVSWQFVAIHDDMHQIGDALISMSHSYQKGEMQDVLMYCEMFRTAVGALNEKELPTLENIF